MTVGDGEEPSMTIAATLDDGTSIMKRSNVSSSSFAMPSGVMISYPCHTSYQSSPSSAITCPAVAYYDSQSSFSRDSDAQVGYTFIPSSSTM